MKAIKSGIYKIEQISTGRVYVGSAVDIENRWLVHKKELRRNCHHSIYLQRTWDKYSEADFKFEILETVEDKLKLIDREQFWMDTLKACDKEFGFNMCPQAGSSLGVKRSAEFCQKLRLANIGRKASEETKLKLSLANSGSKQWMSKLDESKIEKAKARYLQGETATSISKDLGVAVKTLTEAMKGITWKDAVGPIKVKIDGERCGTSKLTWEKVREIRKQLADGVPAKTIAQQMGVCRTNVDKIRLGKTWKEEDSEGDLIAVDIYGSTGKVGLPS